MTRHRTGWRSRSAPRARSRESGRQGDDAGGESRRGGNLVMGQAGASCLRVALTYGRSQLVAVQAGRRAPGTTEARPRRQVLPSKRLVQRRMGEVGSDAGGIPSNCDVLGGAPLTQASAGCSDQCSCGPSRSSSTSETVPAVPGLIRRTRAAGAGGSKSEAS